MDRVLRRLASSALAALIATSAVAWAADEATPNMLRVEVTGGADSLGEIVFSFAEFGVEVTQIPVPIPKGTPENHVARRIHKEVRRALSKGDYDVDLYGGEKVLISSRDPARLFAIRLVRNTVGGTQISIVRE